MASNSNDNSQKHCKCKKTKCLKLYCECFAAGLYCDESCDCQGCCNSPDYEDIVAETRQQIELRNPNAFSSKIHCPTESPTAQTEVGDQPTPVAAKHKKGCNCNKSMCVKKYCECYKANVGCSSECRCQRCENIFGKKGDYNVHNELAPSTQVRHVGHTEDTCTSSIFTGCYIPSQGSATSDTILETSNEISNLVHVDQQPCPDVEFLNQFTPPSIDWPNSSRESGDLSSVNSLHEPGSLVIQVPMFGGSIVNEYNETPNTPTHQVTRPGDKS